MTDPASTNIKNCLLEQSQWDEIDMFSTHPVYRNLTMKDILIITINDRKITHENLDKEIENKLGINLAEIDPQAEFFKPAEEVDKIFQLVGMRYKKKEHDVESICSKINNDDICNALENGRCNRFKDFYEELLL